MTWQKGRDTIETLIEHGELERVTASHAQAESMLADARRHVASARAIAPSDPSGAYALTYDAARKSLAAILEAQGLRATTRGGHVVLYDAARAQFDPPLGSLIRPFNRMRARRNQIEYSSAKTPKSPRKKSSTTSPRPRDSSVSPTRCCRSSTRSDAASLRIVDPYG